MRRWLTCAHAVVQNLLLGRMQLVSAAVYNLLLGRMQLVSAAVYNLLLGRMQLMLLVGCVLLCRVMLVAVGRSHVFTGL